MNSRVEALQLWAWQQEFCDSYLAEPRPRSLLIAPPGSGKTATALYTARELLARRQADAVLVITDHRMLADQWAYSAQRQDLELQHGPEVLMRGVRGAVVTVPKLLIPGVGERLEEAVSSRRLFVIVDEPKHGPVSIDAVVDRLLGWNPENKALVLSSLLREHSTGRNEFNFDREFVLRAPQIVLPATQAELRRYSPSFSLLQEIGRKLTSLDDLSWLQFEKFIATLLEADGYKVEWMGGTKDGGVDVVALKNLGAAGYFKAIWQAKKKTGKNKVGLSVIRELADTRLEHGASKGILVTSTFLTRGALERVERDCYTLAKVDRDDLEHWIQRVLRGERAC